MRPNFPLFQSHLDLAHSYWEHNILLGDTVIDATCGNGNDTLKLAQLAIKNDRGHVYAIDIQSSAIDNTKRLLANQLTTEQMQRINFITGSHINMPKELLPNSTKLIVYNLGYLPGGNKLLTTKSGTTVASVIEAQKILIAGGVISITCYPGHPEGSIEENALLQFSEQLPSRLWSCCYHRWTNRNQAPSLLIIQKALSDQDQD